MYFCFSLSHSRLGGHRLNLFQEVPEASWISYEQTPVMNFQESDLVGEGGGVTYLDCVFMITVSNNFTDIAVRQSN